ncbi:MAG: caspase family protein [Pseudomonadota bacterium]
MVAGWAAAVAETRLALVINQTEYTGQLSRVTLADSEANEIASALRQTGFEVTRKSNLTKRELEQSLNRFRASVELAGTDAVGFIYYTGHGAQHPATQDSYLLGINAEINVASDLAVYGLDMATQRDGFAATGAKAIFMVFDACRNLPGMAGYKANTKGLNRVEARADMLIAYATGLGDVAEEGVYAPILAEELRQAGRTAESAFAAAQRRVARRTNRKQLPWTNNLLYNEICFGGCEVETVVPPVAGVTNRLSPEVAQATYEDGENDYYNGDYTSAIQKYRLACDSGYEPRGCTDLGFLYELGYGVTADSYAANSYYQRGCDGGNFVGCSNLALNLRDGDGIGQDHLRAFDLFKRACDGGYAQACTDLGYSYDEGLGVTVNYSKALELYQQGCDGGNPLGCTNIGFMYEQGNGVQQNFNTARDYYVQGCDAGNGLGCNNLGWLYDAGNGVELDVVLARENFELACQYDDANGCSSLGYYLWEGIGGPVDRQSAPDYMRRGCNGGNQWGCDKLDGYGLPRGT